MGLIISSQRGRMSHSLITSVALWAPAACLLNWTQTITALHRQLYLPAKYVTHNKHILLTDKGQGEVVAASEKRTEMGFIMGLSAQSSSSVDL